MLYADRWMMVLYPYRNMVVISYVLLDYGVLNPPSRGQGIVWERWKGMVALSFKQGGVDNGLAKWRKGRLRGDM